MTIFALEQCVENGVDLNISDAESALAELNTLRTQLAELKAARIAYANEFPLNSDGEPDVGNIHANIRSLKARLVEAQDALQAAQRLIKEALPKFN